VFFPFLFILSINNSFYVPGVHSAETKEFTRGNPITSDVFAPTAVAMDSDDNIYVTESSNNRLRIFNASGNFVKKLTGLKKPTGVFVDSGRKIYICNPGRKNVEVYDSGLNLLYKLGSGNGEFQFPSAVAVKNSGNIYVADAKGDTVKVYRSDGTYSFSFGGTGNDDGKFRFPTSLSIDEAAGEIIVSDLQTTSAGIQGARIQVFNEGGTFKRKVGGYGQGEGLLLKPLGTAVDNTSRIFVSDAYQNIVHVYGSGGEYQKTVYDLQNPMRTPLGIAVSKKTGKLYVASLNTSTVEVYGSGSGSGSDSGSGGGGGGGDNGSLTFSTVAPSGGGCSVTGNPSGSTVSSLEYLFPFLLLLACWLKEKAAGIRARKRRDVMKS
jgi:DNA-binding beta-propeller fold protein YncE